MSADNPVDFLIVGAAKAGTTTLFELLSKHPGIYIPQRKECRYFSCTRGEFKGPGPRYANTVIATQDEYRRLFQKAKPHQLCGDVSPDYLYYHRNAVPKILREKDRELPIIITLRNPIDRAYSSYLYHIRDGREDLDFEQALEAEAERRAANWAWGWFYTECGFYADQVKAYTDHFERVLLLLFERDIVTGRATRKILDFLKLAPAPAALQNIHTNTSGQPRSRRLHRVITGVLGDETIVRGVKNTVKKTPFYRAARQVYRKILELNLKKVALPPAMRQRLKEIYQEDVARLQQNTGLPLTEFWQDFR